MAVNVSHLSLVDFRNYAAAEVELHPGPNLIVGRNGQGKTNLVEALGYLSTLGSHRVSNDQAMIRAGQDAAIIRARLEHGGRTVLAEVQLNRGTPNRAQVNRSAIKPRELPRYFSSVLFAPEDLALVRGEPSGRRKFLDQLLVLRTPRLAGVLADYERVLKQRNTLLKSARARGVKGEGLSTLDIWDERLVGLGSEIIDERMRLTEALRQPLRDAYESVAGDDHGPQLVPSRSIDGADADADDNADRVAARGTSQRYRDPAEESDSEQPPGLDNGGSARPLDQRGASETAERFRVALKAVRPKELERGLTLVGPHRDDLVFVLNALPAKGYASHGESWSFALALKLASAEILRREAASGDPVLILDDVFAELDNERRTRLAAAVTGYEQVLITAAVFDDVPEALAAHTIRIEAGAVVEAGDSVG